MVEPLDQRIMLAGDIEVSYLEFDATTVQVANGDTATFETSATSFDFDVFNIATDDDLYVSDLTFDGNIMNVSFNPIVLTPSDSTSITVEFDGASSGPFTGSITVTSDDPDDNPLTFTVDLELPPPEIEVTYLDANANTIILVDGATAIIDLPLTSYDFEIQNVALDGDLDISSTDVGGLVTGITWASSTISPGSSTSITVDYDPPIFAGPSLLG